MKITVPRIRISPTEMTISGLPVSQPGMPSRIWLSVTRAVHAASASDREQDEQGPLQATLAHPLAIGGRVDCPCR